MPITINGTTGLTTPSLTIGTTTVALSAAELNVLDGASTTLAQPFLANPQNFINPDDKIINGDFNIWQRGATGTVNGYTAADRWMNNYLSGTVSQTRLDHVQGRLFAGNVPPVYLRQSVSGQTAANAYAITTQRIEGVRSYAGQTITILGWARRTTGAGNMVVELEQFFGTGTNTPTPILSGISPTTVPLVAAWMPFAVVVNVPAIDTAVLGNGIVGTVNIGQNDFLGLNFWASSGSDYDARNNSLGIQTLTMDLWGIHIRTGIHTSAATNLYKTRHIETELALCQRYYERFSGVFLTTVTYRDYYFKVTKRAPPTLAVISRDVGTGGTFSPGSLPATQCYQEAANTTASKFLAEANAEL